MEEKDKIISLMDDLGINIESILRLSFSGYKQMKETKQLYSRDVSTPEQLITLYYSLHPDQIHIDKVHKAFVTRYVNNENKISGLLLEEEVRKNEKDGLRRMYEYIKSNLIDKDFSIYTLNKLHEILFYDTTLHSEGGKYRTQEFYDESINVSYSDPKNISSEMKELDSLAKKLYDMGGYIKHSKDPHIMLNYLDECVKLSTLIIKTHPFMDGNGQVVRAFLNKLFINAGLPFVYIKESEKEDYFIAVERAITLGDFEDITNFYRYKVCDSIIELDINERYDCSLPLEKDEEIDDSINYRIRNYEREKILKYCDYIGLDIENIIRLCFCGYKYLKSKKKLYSSDSIIPDTLISLYYSLNPDEVSFNHMKTEFVNKYVTNESKVEQAHNKEEIDGFKVMYEYIHSDEINNKFDIFTLAKIHKRLYSLAPCPDFGGSIRNRDVYLPGSGANLSSFSNIIPELCALNPEAIKLHEEGAIIKLEQDPEHMLKYMDKCVILGCKLILIHPFGDGNGRSVRGFVNKLLEDGGLPPIYIKANEKLEYQQAMEKALCENDFESITNFYRFKICDSIIELDINDRVKEFNEMRGIYNKSISSLNSDNFSHLYK